MRKCLLYFISFLLLAMPVLTHAILSMELTRGIAAAIPIKIEDFTVSGSTPSQNVAGIIRNDLQNSGRFKVGVKDSFNIVSGNIRETDNQSVVSFTLREAFNKNNDNVLLKKTFEVNRADFRKIAHHISDLIYQALTGIRGVFSTKIAYIVIVRNENNHKRYILEVADQDGYQPKPLLNSPEPIMSPSWSPDGKRIAYVSFEKHHAAIFIQDIVSGARRLISEYPGINGAPAFSADGKKLAIVLSKGGAPNIYILDIATNHLNQITHDNYINTEPAWSLDGKRLLFTSNRQGGVELYQIELSTRNISRISFDGDYNARGAYTADGHHISMIHKVGNSYNIALLDLNTGITKVLNGFASDSASPSLAPNGSMVLYDTVMKGRNVLGMVSSDGRIQLLLPAPSGDAQDPAWSPYLS